MIRELLDDGKYRMNGALKVLESDLATFRTGRANPALLARLVVEMYGVEMNLNQIGLVSVPEPQQLSIRPFDQNSLGAIEKAILKSDLGLTPNNDGKLIRLNIPRLTEERRRDLSRLVGKRVEEARVAVRNVRRDIQNDFRDLKKEGELTEDELSRALEDLQDLTDKYVESIDAAGKTKEAEIMEV